MDRRNFILTGTCAFFYPVTASFNQRGTKEIFENQAPKKLWKWSKEAYYYINRGNKTVCMICPNHCELSPNDRSACRVKVNIKGKMYSLVYGNPCAVNIDPVEKKPLYHFYPQSKTFSIATAGCNFRCLNCQNWQISQSKPEKLNNYEMFPDGVIKNAINYDCKSIAYTYSEPTVFYEYMFDTARKAKESGINNIWITNGYMSRGPLEKLCKYIDAANVDLKSFSDKTYQELNGGRLKHVLDTLKILKDQGVWAEITVLLVPTYTDDIETVKRISSWVIENLGPNCPVHFSRFHPQYKLEHLPPTDIEKVKHAKREANKIGLNYVYTGNLGYDDSADTLCPNCNNTLIKRRGYEMIINNMKKNICTFCGHKIAGRF